MMPGVDAPEVGPAPHEGHARGERLAQEHVDAAGVREGRGQLGADQGADEGEDAGQRPGDEDAGDGRHFAGDLGGLHEDRRPDDRPDDHGRGLRQADGAGQLRCAEEAEGGGMTGRV